MIVLLVILFLWAVIGATAGFYSVHFEKGAFGGMLYDPEKDIDWYLLSAFYGATIGFIFLVPSILIKLYLFHKRTGKWNIRKYYLGNR